MASARHLCQHSDSDGIQCTLDDYLLCPHCQLQLCLKHINHHQDLLRNDLNLLCDDVNRIRSSLDHLTFDTWNRRRQLLIQLDEWRQEQIARIDKIYVDKKEELNILCLQAHMEFDTYKSTKDVLLKEKITRPLNRTIGRKQIQVNDILEIRRRLQSIEKGLDELKQLHIDMNLNNNSMNINIIKRPYIEAAQPLVIDDDDDLSDTDDENESNESKAALEENTRILQRFFSRGHLTPSASPPDIIFLSTPSSPPPPLPSVALTPSPPPPPPPISPPVSSTVTTRKAPLKFIIKRLQQPATATGVKYKLRTVATSAPLIT